MDITHILICTREKPVDVQYAKAISIEMSKTEEYFQWESQSFTLMLAKDSLYSSYVVT